MLASASAADGGGGAVGVAWSGEKRSTIGKLAKSFSWNRFSRSQSVLRRSSHPKKCCSLQEPFLSVTGGHSPLSSLCLGSSLQYWKHALSFSAWFLPTGMVALSSQKFQLVWTFYLQKRWFSKKKSPVSFCKFWYNWILADCRDKCSNNPMPDIRVAVILQHMLNWTTVNCWFLVQKTAIAKLAFKIRPVLVQHFGSKNQWKPEKPTKRLIFHLLGFIVMVDCPVALKFSVKLHLGPLKVVPGFDWSNSIIFLWSSLALFSC